MISRMWRMSIQWCTNVRAVRYAFLVAALVLAGITVSSAASAAVPTLPDLVIAPITSATVDTSTSPGRRLLRFTTEIDNVGAGPFEVKGQRSTTADATMSVEQHVFNSDGTFSVRPTPAKMIFDVGDGHQHWHVDKLEQYELFSLPDLRKQPQEGAKAGYCFYDGHANDLTLPGAPFSSVYTNCGVPLDLTVTTGLSIGWGDIYPYNIANQWIDITDVPAGSYRDSSNRRPLWLVPRTR